MDCLHAAAKATEAAAPKATNRFNGQPIGIRAGAVPGLDAALGLRSALFAYAAGLRTAARGIAAALRTGRAHGNASTR
jgi:hypothetical protein